MYINLLDAPRELVIALGKLVILLEKLVML